jgi:hypothetical protein
MTSFSSFAFGGAILGVVAFVFFAVSTGLTGELFNFLLSALLAALIAVLLVAAITLPFL